MLSGLDLFSGIGGIGLALKPWVRTVAYCEQDRYAQGVLLSRMQSGDIDRAPIWDDVRTLQKEHLPNIDIIYGGFPCQDISVAGTGVGLGGERSGLFYHIARLVSETNPKFVFLENVPAIRTRGLNSVTQTFTELGYDCRWTIVSAKEVGACHERKRWFMLAHANSDKLRVQLRAKLDKKKILIRSISEASNDTYATSQRLEGASRNESRLAKPARFGQWLSQPGICRRVNGLSNRVDRIKALGNAVVPLQVEKAFEKLLNIKEIT